jgi:hypothetical protein
MSPFGRRVRHWRSLALGAALAVAMSLATAAPSGAQEPGAAVVGRVVTTAGQPVPAAEVTLSRDGVVVTRTVTDGAGHFRLAALPAGLYLLRAGALGYGPYEGPLRLEAGATARVTATVEVVAVAVEGITVRAQRDRARFEEQAGATVVELTGQRPAPAARPGGGRRAPGHRGHAGRDLHLRLLRGVQRAGRGRRPEPDPAGRRAHLQPVPSGRRVQRLQRGHGGSGRAHGGRVPGPVRRTRLVGA